jgi:hypothetical protein
MAAKSKKDELAEAREELARAEYLNKFLLTCSFTEAEDAYRSSLASLSAEIPPELELDAIGRRKGMLQILEPEILQVKRQEFKEIEVLLVHLRKLVLQDEVAETGIPNELTLDDLKNVDSDAIMAVLNGFDRVQEMRRRVLTS